MGQATSSYPTVDLSGKVILVTGGNVGLGYATAKVLATMGAHTIIACRSGEKAEAAVAQMKEEIGKQFPDKSINLEWMILDLGSFRSTKDFTVAFKEKNLPLHVLVNNAGVAAPPFSLTEDGHETQFQVNHLSHLLLSLELLPIIMDTASNTGDGRIVIVSSAAHESGVFDPDNLDGQQSFSRFKFYSNSKLYNVMTAYALQRRLQNVSITVSSLHPGFVRTTLGHQPNDSNAKKNFMSAMWFLMSPITKNVDNGAATQINCAVNPELNKQKMVYYADSAPKEPTAAARDGVQQEQLWEISINMIKEFLTPELLQQYGPTLPVSQEEQQGEEQTTAEGQNEPREEGVEQEQTSSPVAPVGETQEQTSSPAAPVGETQEQTSSPAAPVGETQEQTSSPAAPVGETQEQTSSPAAPVGETQEQTSSPAAPVGETQEQTSSPAAPVGETQEQTSSPAAPVEETQEQTSSPAAPAEETQEQTSSPAALPVEETQEQTSSPAAPVGDEQTEEQ